jgi:hypothetical protein
MPYMISQQGFEKKGGGLWFLLHCPGRYAQFGGGVMAKRNSFALPRLPAGVGSERNNFACYSLSCLASFVNLLDSSCRKLVFFRSLSEVFPNTLLQKPLSSSVLLGLLACIA